MNEYIHRSLLDKLVKHIDERQMFVVLGPRQAGKTTLFTILQKHLRKKKNIAENNIFFFTFEDPDVRTQFNQNPKEFMSRRLEALSGRAYFFFDEFHWTKEGGQKLKLLFDLYTPQVKFFITGSSSLEITFQTGKFLVGRAYFFYLYPLSFAEFLQTKEKEILSAYNEFSSQIHAFQLPAQKTIFDNKLSRYFAEFCLYGGYPEVVKRSTSEEKKLLLDSIRKTYLEKDIRSLLLIDDIEGYRKLLQILAAQIGSLLSYNNICSDTGLTYKTVKKYLSILEETFVIRRIKPFYKNITSELRKNPKLYFYDSGMRNSLLRLFHPLPERTDKGELVENFVFTQLIKTEADFNYWRTKGKAEVDFILKQEQNLYPIEVKYRNMKKPQLSRSLHSFLSTYQPAKALVLTNGFWGRKKLGKTDFLFIPIWYW